MTERKNLILLTTGLLMVVWDLPPPANAPKVMHICVIKSTREKIEGGTV